MWITTKQVADQFGVTMRRVRQIAKDRGIEGRKIGSVLVWTQEQVTAIKRQSPLRMGVLLLHRYFLLPK